MCSGIVAATKASDAQGLGVGEDTDDAPRMQVVAVGKHGKWGRLGGAIAMRGYGQGDRPVGLWLLEGKQKKQSQDW